MIREYHCATCQQDHEVITSAEAPAEKKCIYCNHQAKLIIYSPSAFVLRGAWAEQSYSRQQ